MKTKLTTLLFVLVAGMFTQTTQAQVSEECRTTLSLFSEAAKVKNWTAAKPHYDKLVKDCPNASLAIYQYGEKMFKQQASDASGAESVAFAKDLIHNYELREQYFPAKTPHGENIADIAQTMYDYKIGSTMDEFKQFEKAWKEDRESIKSSKSIYTYFKLAVDLYKEGQYELQDIFDLYDDVQDKLSEEGTQLDAKLQKLIEKEEAGTKLTAKEGRLKKAYETNLKAFGIFAGSVDGTLGSLADCENLIPLYNKGFEENKNDKEWINKAASRMLSKECTDDPLFKKLVEQLHALNPSADSAKYLMILCAKSGDKSCENKYFEEALSLSTGKQKADLLYQKAESTRRAGSYGQARTLYTQVLELNPGKGICYLRIAAMYAQSANNCGTTTFEKRATYWLAADTAERAGRVDPRLAGNANATAANYRGKAPSKSDIFSAGMGGKSVKLSCWIGRTIQVPNL
ncbi:hypothetical protein EAX61_09190 [Dokdonia sinensis]|uniref:Uncharacterized protein n=1 Tax=Dokdonia sinensis TaxID=2479847 RepID=A0A3M0GDJ2_9FLAO|nr:hypothetical protein [Dokdonia sinensis]RMB59219.1 hypothetical protein EAX61_09190 [Dokdonia sinensis]